MNKNKLRYYITLIIILLMISCNSNIYSQNKKLIAEQNRRIAALNVKLTTAIGTDRVNTLNELSWEYRLMDKDKGLEYSQEAMKQAVKLKFNSGEADAYVNMGYLYVHKCMPELANNYYTKALNMFKCMNNPKKYRLELARIDEGLGLLAYQQLDYNKAIDCYNRALRLYQSMSNHKNIAICYRIIGMIYEKAGYKEKANQNYFSELKNTVRTTDKNVLSSYNDFENLGD